MASCLKTINLRHVNKQNVQLHVQLVMASRCYDNCDFIETVIINNSSSLSNTTVLSPGNFSKSLFIARSLFSNVRGIDREKMRRATSAITSWIVFLQEILLITDSFFHKIKFARTFKKCFPSVRFGCRKYFFCRY